MKILITGVNGQVGYELMNALRDTGDVIGLNRTQMNLADLNQVRYVVQSIKPDLIINPGAYTAVDQAEQEPELTMLINGRAPGVLAEEAKKIGAAIIHYSTDYVFDGCKTTPYKEDDEPNPINVYGKTKLAGEHAIQAVGVPHLILRTSWIYGARGKNFLLTILRLAKERDELRVVADQIGAPTWCCTIAEATANVISLFIASNDHARWWEGNSGVYHLSAQGNTSWYEFAQTILESTTFEKKPVIIPISTEEYPTPAKRPHYSVLSSERFIATFCDLPLWNDAFSKLQFP